MEKRTLVKQALCVSSCFGTYSSSGQTTLQRRTSLIGSQQQTEMLDPAHQQPEHKRSNDAPQTGRKLYHLLIFSFGLLCVLQATLNVSLRLSADSNMDSTCNRTQVQDSGQRTRSHCNALQERFNALARKNSQLENQISELKNGIRNNENQRRTLEQKLKDLLPCPRHWNNIGDRCYYFSIGTKSWELSRRFCHREGSNLVVINSTEEQIYLRRDTDRFWIGLKNSTGTFRWVDGSDPVKVFWQIGQPDSGGRNNTEDCVEMDQSQNTVLANWNNAPCGQKNRWLCEKESGVTPIN